MCVPRTSHYCARPPTLGSSARRVFMLKIETEIGIETEMEIEIEIEFLF